jgi:hypothetical protein
MIKIQQTSDDFLDFLTLILNILTVKVITNIKPYFIKRLDQQGVKSNESAIATIDARGLRNALASFDTRALRSAIDFTIKGKSENQNIDLRKTIF